MLQSDLKFFLISQRSANNINFLHFQLINFNNFISYTFISGLCLDGDYQMEKMLKELKRMLKEFWSIIKRITFVVVIPFRFIISEQADSPDIVSVVNKSPVTLTSTMGMNSI